MDYTGLHLDAAEMTRRLSLHANPLPAALPASGDVVGSKYRIDRQLGHGGMGAVFEVTHTVTGRRFAIKWLLSTNADGPHGVKRFVREAQIAGRIQHPHVVDVYDIYQEEDRIFLVMELLQGESLSSRLAREGCLSAEQACRIMLPCASGVAAAHAGGVVHRDLKPANIFLCKTADEVPHPKVLDFGISQLMATDLVDTTEKRTGTVIGTPYYMAPEQLQGEACDQRVDVYALGVTLYEMLSGKRPYEGASYAELVLKIARGRPTPLHEMVPELPAKLVAIVARAMHREAGARYPSVSALIEALRPYAAPHVPGDRLHTRRRPAWRAPALAGAALIGLGAGAFILYTDALYSSTSQPEAAAQPTRATRAATVAVGAPRLAAAPIATAPAVPQLTTASAARLDDETGAAAGAPLAGKAGAAAPQITTATAFTKEPEPRAESSAVAPPRRPARSPSKKRVAPAELAIGESATPAPHRAPRLQLDGL